MLFSPIPKLIIISRQHCPHNPYCKPLLAAELVGHANNLRNSRSFFRAKLLSDLGGGNSFLASEKYNDDCVLQKHANSNGMGGHTSSPALIFISASFRIRLTPFANCDLSNFRNTCAHSPLGFSPCFSVHLSP